MSQPNSDEYLVGWICALASEFAAAQAMLDEQYDMVSGQDRNDSNSYALGRIHKHNIVIARLPDGIDGTNAAAVVATNLTRSFRCVRFGLLVGIGGGIPNLKENIDIRLGDIVVSQPRDISTGVIQYDKGKILLTAIGNLQARHLMEESRVSEFLNQMLENRPKMRKGFSFPVQEVDILRCTHDTQASTSTSCEYCCDGKVNREPRESTQPNIHFGVIASGNQVIKSATHRDQLRDTCDGAICVEMEAAGLMDNFPCLVIRGICDYADSSKNDHWHNYAAATAAAFAKELLLYVTAGQIVRERPMSDVLGFLVEAREHHQHQEEHNRQQLAHNLQQDIQRIPIVGQAIYGAQGEVHQRCHPRTRVDLLGLIQQWACHPSSKPILWLHGQAGTGKSTISWTITEWLANQDHSQHSSLGASFFFKRGGSDRCSAMRFVPTVIRQLIVKMPELGPLVLKAIESDSLIFSMALAQQFRRLILHPLRKLRKPDIQQPPLIVAIDAVDECESQADIETILKLWSELSRLTNINVRLFLTSRPEITVQLQFQQTLTALFQDIDLVEAVPESTIREDIYIYLNDSLCSIREQYNSRLQHRSMIDHSWPDKDTVQQLTDLAFPLFIVAATICRFVGDLELSPTDSLAEFLSSRKTGQMSQMELTYVPVLNHLVLPAREPEQSEKLYREFRTVVGSIILLAEALSVSSLSSLLALESEIVHRRIAPLRSVLRVPSDQDTPVRLLHLSFTEFLLSEKTRVHPFSIDGDSTHLKLSDHCLRVLSCSDGLRENICDLNHPGQSRHELKSTTVTNRLPPVMKYACRHWVHHIKHSLHQLEDGGRVHTFLQKHFLHWLEALSLIDHISMATSLIGTLQSCIGSTASNLAAFLEDARRFVLANRSIIDKAPRQLYSSAIIFSPQNSVVRSTYSQVPSWILRYPRAVMNWGAELQKLEGHSYGISAISFSPNSSLVATGSRDCTIRLWDINTGQELLVLEGHPHKVAALSFSLDGSLLASGATDLTFRLWDAQTGLEKQRFGEYSDMLDAVLFSPDGSLFVWGFGCEIQIWETQTGRVIQRLKVPKEISPVSIKVPKEISSVSISPDGSLIASGILDREIRLWELRTGREVKKLEGHSRCVRSVSFSPDGCTLASGSDDRTILLWDIQTGRETKRLEGHSDDVLVVSFSSNGSLLVSGSRDRTVRLWEVRTGRELQRFEGHSADVWAVSFSPDGSIVASGSDDQTVRLWDVQARSDPQELEGHSKWILAIALSPDGSLIASGSKDGTIRLWDVQTGQELRRIERYCHYNTHFLTMFFSPDSSLLVLGHDGTTILLEVQTWKMLRILDGHFEVFDWHAAGSFSPNGSLLATGSVDKNARLWDVKTGEMLQNFGENTNISAITFSRDGSLLAINFHYTEIEIWEVQTGRMLNKLGRNYHSLSMESMAMSFSPDSSLLAVGYDDQKIRLWEVQTGRELWELQTHIIPYPSTINFTDNTTLITDQGAFNINEGGTLITENFDPTTEGILNVPDSWVRYKGRNLLWLPQEYRGQFVSHDNLLVIGANSGRVIIFRFDFSASLD